MNARRRFVDRIRAYTKACGKPNLVSTGIILPSEDPARLLRNGLSVVAFATLEQFIRSRSKEVLLYISNTGVSFGNLSARLQRDATVGAVKALCSQMRIRSNTDNIEHVQRQSQMIASTSTDDYQLSNLRFGHGSSNISSGTVNSIMQSIGVSNGWDNIDKIATRVSLSSPSLKSSYDEAIDRRNRCAHQADAVTEIDDLESFAMQAIAIALSFDALISQAGYFYGVKNDDFLNNGDRFVSSDDVQIRFLDYRDENVWAEQAEKNQKATRVGERDILLPIALERASRNGEILVIRDQRSIPIDWRVGTTS